MKIKQKIIISSTVIGLILVLAVVIIFSMKLGSQQSVFQDQCSLPSCPTGYTLESSSCSTSNNRCTGICKKQLPDTCSNSYSSSSISPNSIISLNPDSGVAQSSISSNGVTETNKCYKYSGHIDYDVLDWGIIGASSGTLFFSSSTDSITKGSKDSGSAFLSTQNYGQGTGNAISASYKVTLNGGTGKVNSASAQVFLDITESSLITGQFDTQSVWCTYDCDQSSECAPDADIGSPTCSGNNIVQQYTHNTCSSFICQPSTLTRVVSTCANGCSAGSCLACTQDNQCSGGSTGQNYCSSGNVVRDVVLPKCVSSSCTTQTNTETVQTCLIGCENNACINQPTCTAGFIGDKFCSGKDIVQLFQNTDCTNETRINSTCAIGCLNGNCTTEVPITCTAGFIGSKTCNGLNITQNYQNTNCTNQTKLVETCQYSCSAGSCVNNQTNNQNYSTFYRYRDNSCASVSILASEKTANDYLTIDQCRTFISNKDCSVSLNKDACCSSIGYNIWDASTSKCTSIQINQQVVQAPAFNYTWIIVGVVVLILAILGYIFWRRK
jgi:hypothetical protein